MPIYEINKFSGGISDYEDRGIAGAFKFGKNLDIRKQVDSLSCNQALKEEGIKEGQSPSASQSPSSSASPSASPSHTASPSASTSPSSSVSHSPSGSSGISDSPSRSPSASASPSASTSPSHSPSPSPSPSMALTSVFRDLIYFYVKAVDGYTYGFGSTGYIYRRSESGTENVVVYKDQDGAIKGASEWYDDDGNTYLYWATDTKEKRKLMPGRDDWNDVEIVGSLTSADWHTQRECGGSLIIANASTLALVGYDSSFTNEALNLIPGNLAKTITERNGRTIVGTVRASNPSEGVNAQIDSEFPLAQIGTDGEIFFDDMATTVPSKRFPGGGRVNPDGRCNMVDQINFFEWEQTAQNWIDKQTIGNMAMFGVFSADEGRNGIYSYGRKNKNKPFVMNLEYEMDVDEIGALCNVNGVLIASYRSGTTFGQVSVDPTTKAEAVYEGLDYKAPIKGPEDPCAWGLIEVLMKPLPANCWVEFWYRTDKYGDFIKTKLADGSSTNYTKTNSKKALYRVQADGQIYEPRVVLHPSGNSTPEVYRIRTWFN